MAGALAAEAQDTAQAFTSLINSMTDFTATFQLFSAKQGAADQQLIDSLNANITALMEQIQQYARSNHCFTSLPTQMTCARYNTDIAGIAGGMGVTVFASISLMRIFPVAAPFIIVSPCRFLETLQRQVSVKINTGRGARSARGGSGGVGAPFGRALR